jgi:H+-transporting ATPase
MEELAGIDALCSGKTGTLTQNKLTLGEPYCAKGVRRDDLILAGELASRVGSQDAIDMAVIGGLKNPHELDSYHTLHFQPFDPVHKRTKRSWLAQTNPSSV